MEIKIENIKYGTQRKRLLQIEIRIFFLVNTISIILMELT